MNTQIVKMSGGYLERTLEAVNGFHRKHGNWPTTLRIAPDAVYVLCEHHLTLVGFQMLCGKLRLVLCDEVTLVSEDDAGRTFDYATEGWTSEPSQVHFADQWIWGTRLN